MSWLRRLFRRVVKPDPYAEVQARVEQFRTERQVRMNRYAAAWRKKWAEQGIALERRAQMRRVR
jgi:hypothetical protein